MRASSFLAGIGFWACALLGLAARAAAGGEGELGALVPIFADGFQSGNVSVWNPGPGPTENCVFTPDPDTGFFTLNSGMTDYVVRLPVGYDVANPTPSRKAGRKG